MHTSWNGNVELSKQFADLTGKVAIITGNLDFDQREPKPWPFTGASRGIGRECALSLARLGCRIVIAAKTIEPQPTLPGTIYTVAEEVERLGVQALPYQLVSTKFVELCTSKTTSLSFKM
jgi:hypothetical protein